MSQWGAVGSRRALQSVGGAGAAMLVMVSAEVSGPESGRARVCFVGHLARAQEFVAASAPATPSAWALMWAG